MSKHTSTPAAAATLHELKTWPHYFEAVLDGRKTFEVRKADRDFQEGDGLLLREWEPSTEKYTGRSLERRISYIVRGVCGLPMNVAVLALLQPECEHEHDEKGEHTERLSMQLEQANATIDFLERTLKALQPEPNEALNDILFRAYYYDDKPHQLFTAIARAAKGHEDEDEIVRLMHLATETPAPGVGQPERPQPREEYRCPDCGRQGKQIFDCKPCMEWRSRQPAPLGVPEPSMDADGSRVLHYPDADRTVERAPQPEPELDPVRLARWAAASRIEIALQGFIPSSVRYAAVKAVLDALYEESRVEPRCKYGFKLNGCELGHPGCTCADEMLAALREITQLQIDVGEWHLLPSARAASDEVLDTLYRRLSALPVEQERTNQEKEA